MTRKSKVNYTPREEVIHKYGVKQGINDALDVGVGIGEILTISSLMGFYHGTEDPRYVIATAGAIGFGALYYGVSHLVGKFRNKKEQKILSNLEETANEVPLEVIRNSGRD